VYDGLHKKRKGGRARADRRAPSQTSTATARTRSCMRSAMGMDEGKEGPINDALSKEKKSYRRLSIIML